MCPASISHSCTFWSKRVGFECYRYSIEIIKLLNMPKWKRVWALVSSGEEEPSSGPSSSRQIAADAHAAAMLAEDMANSIGQEFPPPLPISCQFWPKKVTRLNLS